MAHVIVMVYHDHPIIFYKLRQLGYPIKKINDTILLKISIDHRLKGLHHKRFKWERIKREHEARQEYHEFIRGIIGTSLIDTFAV